ncbi:MAG: FTR1 family protein [Sulfobacillus thermotolerans]|uniref:Iron permease n=1 Tax=Sulfobacillus thermotolerans TaxID=338644 RepID=A0ABM6RPV5_9FIRM|nr:hypothetical protein BXT84_04920 [Sulfobacillus thermotolerans]MCY0906992.1 FTR1 family protein [Sulfobacillus thermotolerans]
MLPTLVIFARESVEASMIVAIILSYLRQIGRRDLTFMVWTGTVIALVSDAAIGTFVWENIHRYRGTRLQIGFEGTTYFAAAVMLTAMSFWMKKQSQHLKYHIQHDVARSLTRSSRWTLALLSGVTVGREGLETTIFVLALSFRTAPAQLLTGAVLGIAMGLSLSYWMYHLGRRIPLRTFFSTFGVLLLLFADALISDGVEDYQALHWIPWGRRVLWHSGRYLRESGALGDLLHTFIGYAQSPTLLQVVLYLGLLAPGIYLFLKPWGHQTAKP